MGRTIEERIDCSQSPIFPLDHRDIAHLTVNCGYLDFQIYRGGGCRDHSARSRRSYGKIGDCEQSKELGTDLRGPHLFASEGLTSSTMVNWLPTLGIDVCSCKFLVISQGLVQERNVQLTYLLHNLQYRDTLIPSFIVYKPEIQRYTHVSIDHER